MIQTQFVRAFSLLLILLSLSACSDDKTATQQRKPTPHLVETARVDIQQVSIQKTLPGTLEAIRTVKIFNQEQSILTSLPFYEGQRVTKGTTLATLDNALIKADLNKAKATLKQAQLDLKRLQNLIPRKLASEDEIAKAKTAVDIAEAELNLQKTRLAHTRIQAPFDGIISLRQAEPGDVVPLHSHILSLIDTSSLKIRLFISELLLPLIKPGDAVSIRIDALPDQSFNGEVVRTHPTIDSNTRRGIVEVVLKPVPNQALPGQLARVSLSTQQQARLMMPFDALRHDNRGPYVFVVENQQAKHVAISTGLQTGEYIEVVEGLTRGDLVITKGFFGLKHNKTVTVTKS